MAREWVVEIILYSFMAQVQFHSAQRIVVCNRHSRRLGLLGSDGTYVRCGCHPMAHTKPVPNLIGTLPRLPVQM